jgi:ankyrin repeat protein
MAERNDATVESKDEDGRTPLSYATARGHEEVVPLLLDTGRLER